MKKLILLVTFCALDCSSEPAPSPARWPHATIEDDAATATEALLVIAAKRKKIRQEMESVQTTAKNRRINSAKGRKGLHIWNYFFPFLRLTILDTVIWKIHKQKI
jgi:hypothetical protein